MDRKEYLVIGGLIAFVLGVGVLTSSNYANADNTNAIDEVNISVPIACTMSGAIATGHEHTASINPNTYEDDIGETTITTTCNDSGGYAIYAIGFTGDKYTGEDHTKLIGNSTGAKIGTGTGTSGNSQWAMKVTAVTGTYAPTIVNSFDGSGYHVVPDTYTKVATFNSTTDVGAGATGSSIKTTYAAYISGTQAADTCNGKVKYTLVHPNTETPLHPETTTTGKIHYWPNGSAVVGTMSEQDVASSVTLLASNYSREGYGFAGWNTEFDYSGTFYGPNETISLNTADYTGDNNGLSLYAVWVKSQGNLQDSAKVASVCNSLTTAPIDGTANLSSVSALTDQRDNNTYAIAKLAGGKCWMIENLRLDNTATGNSDGSLAQGYGGQFAGLANPETANFDDSTTANSLYSTDGADNTINIGTNYASYRFPRYNNQNISDRASAPAISTNTYSYGNYYTWAAAMANTDNLTSSSTSEATNTSLCPTGWKLPTSGSSDKDFAMLYTNLSNTPANIRRYPNNFLYSGKVYGSPVSGGGSYGIYWSESAYNYGYAYNLDIFSSVVNPSDYGSKNNGFSVRCLAQ